MLPRDSSSSVGTSPGSCPCPLRLLLLLLAALTAADDDVWVSPKAWLVPAGVTSDAPAGVTSDASPGPWYSQLLTPLALRTSSRTSHSSLLRIPAASPLLPNTNAPALLLLLPQPAAVSLVLPSDATRP